MIVIQPASITPDKVIATNIPAESTAAYSPSKTYAVDELAVYANHIWQSAAASNVGNTPGVPPATGPAKWVDRGAINQYRMFDKKVGGNTWNIGLYSSRATSIDITLKPGQVVDSVALFGLQGSSVAVYMNDPVDGNVFYDNFPLADTGVNDWWEYFFKPFDRKEALIVDGLPAYGTANIRIVVTNPGAEARLGFAALGQAVSLGTTEYGTSISLENYSLNKTDEFGNRTLVVRGSASVVDYDVKLLTTDTSRVQKLLRKLKDTPSVYVGDSDYELTLTMGLFKSFNINLENWGLSSASLEVTSLES